ncbi:MAG TPA: DinB family protein [Dehalococcoidia bacterium]
MPASAYMSKNIEFWHWYPELLVKGLTAEQMRWQPDGHDTSITFAIWHAYRSCDDLVHGLVMQGPSVFVSESWAERLPIAETGVTAFGNGLNREQIGRLDFDIDTLLAYARAVGASIGKYTASLTDDAAAEEIKLPFFTGVYPNVDVMTRAETIAFFAIGHVSEHLGEVQFVKGLLGMQGAPL